MDIKSKKIEVVGIDTLIPYSKNMNKHTPDQIDRLIKLIEYQGFRDPLIVQKGTNIIAAGHGRWQAAKKMGIKEIPVVFQEFENEAQFYSFVVSHNAINSSNWGGGLDLAQVNVDISEIEGIDIDHLGVKAFTIEPIPEFNLDEELSDTDAVDLTSGTKKSIMVDYEPEHYEEAYDLIRYWRNKDAYVGMMILTFLKQKKDENN